MDEKKEGNDGLEKKVKPSDNYGILNMTGVLVHCPLPGSLEEKKDVLMKRIDEKVKKYNLQEEQILDVSVLETTVPAFSESILTIYNLAKYVAGEKGIPFGQAISEIIKPAGVSLPYTSKEEKDIRMLVGAISMIGIGCPELADKSKYAGLSHGERVMGCGTVELGRMLMDYASKENITPRMPFPVSEVNSMLQCHEIRKN